MKDIPKIADKEILKSIMAKKSESVRTTFSFTARELEALSWLSENASLTMKELLDKLILDFLPPFLKTPGVREVFMSNKEKRGEIAMKKSMVLSKKSLNMLNIYARDNDIPRDLLVSFLITYCETSMRVEEEMTRKNHEEVRDLLTALHDQASILEGKIINICADEDDPIPYRFSFIMLFIENLISDITDEIDKGIQIDPEVY